MSQSESEQKDSKESPAVLRAISVAGYKSIGERQRIEIRPLTLLAGVNSGGKSSLIQPMLLLKQTLEAPYDPGSLLLDGPNVRLTSADQLLSKCVIPSVDRKLIIAFEVGDVNLGFSFVLKKNGLFEIMDNTISNNLVLKSGIELRDLKDMIADSGSIIDPRMTDFIDYISRERVKHQVRVQHERFYFLVLIGLGDSLENFSPYAQLQLPSTLILDLLRKIIHVPGLRGNPERTYKTTAVGDTFPGTFENYVASIINQWKIDGDARLISLGKQLAFIGLASRIEAKRLNDAQVELKVSRLPPSVQSDTEDLVSIADVGFGVSQTLPVLVALLTAKPGQVVYLEQPEIHLHPRAQLAMAKILAEAAQRGVIVIAETHSALLLQGIQTLVAKDELDKNLVKLHWVRRDEKGMTQVDSADLDDTGAFGDWPVDFMEVGLDADNEYLSAAEAKLFRQTS